MMWRTMKSYKFNDIFDCVDLPVFIHDKDFRLLYANEAYYAIAHTDESAAIGKVCWACFLNRMHPQRLLCGDFVKERQQLQR